MKKSNIISVLLIVIATVATSFSASAQQRARHISYTGNHCWLGEVRGSVLFDKNPITGAAKAEAGGFARVSLYKKGWYAYAEGGYQRSDFAGYIGGGVKLAERTWVVQPKVELGIGLGNQYCGYNYKAAVSENTEAGKLDILVSEQFLDSKIKPQGRLALDVEIRCSDRVSVIAGAEGIYRFSEAKTLEPNGNLVVNGQTIDAKTGAIEMKSNKFVMGVSLGVVIRIL